MTKMKIFIQKLQAVKSSFIEKILPAIDNFPADKEEVMCLLSLVLTSVSASYNPIGYACIGYDTFSLVRALARKQLFSWQSAVSIVSIVLTVVGMMVCASVAPYFSVASIALDLFMLIYAIWEQLTEKK